MDLSVVEEGGGGEEETLYRSQAAEEEGGLNGQITVIRVVEDRDEREQKTRRRKAGIV